MDQRYQSLNERHLQECRAFALAILREAQLQEIAPAAIPIAGRLGIWGGRALLGLRAMGRGVLPGAGAGAVTGGVSSAVRGENPITGAARGAVSGGISGALSAPLAGIGKVGINAKTGKVAMPKMHGKLWQQRAANQRSFGAWGGGIGALGF